MDDYSSIFREILRTAHFIREVDGASTAPPMDCRVVDLRAADLPTMVLPEPLTPQLIDIGLPQSAAEAISIAYLRKVEGFRAATEKIVHSTCSTLTSLPRVGDMMPLEVLRQQIFDTHQTRYMATVSEWATEIKEMVLSRLTSATENSSTHVVKRKRQFKSEYLPLFEFAFEKDRFPNREDKKHLAKISGMSYRQVCVWFQNRRCRHTSRGKPHNSSPPPRTFEEMKQRLSASAREALSRVPSALIIDPPHTPTPDASSSNAPLFRGVVTSSIGGLKEETVPDRAASLEASEVSENSVDSEEHDELEYDDARMDHIALPSPMSSLFSLEHMSRPMNPLDPLNTPTANVFPAPYQPLKPASNPFVVEHQPWLRSNPEIAAPRFINPTPEALENLMDGFDGMEVDVPDLPLGSVAAPESRKLNLQRLTTPFSLRTPPNSQAIQRTFSSGSSASWSSDASAPLSRSTSYSTAPSSVLSSPNISEISLPIQSECGNSPPALTAPSPSADSESTCDTPVDEVAQRAGPFPTESTKPTSKARVDAWVSGVSTQEDDDHSAHKWQQLLAAAAEASPVP